MKIFEHRSKNMLAIQPNLRTNGMQTKASFGNGYMSEDVDFERDNSGLKDDEFVAKKDNDLAAVKDEISEAMDNLKELQEELPPVAKKVMGGLFTLGAAAVAGISTKFGVSETSKMVKGISKKESVKAATANLKSSVGKVTDAVGNFFDTVKKSDLYKNISAKISTLVDKFEKTKFGQKTVELFNKVAKSSFVKKIKDLFASTKNIKTDKVVDRTGDVLGAATGISTAAVSIINPEQKEEVEG